MKVDINFNHSHSNVGLYYVQMLAVLVLYITSDQDRARMHRF